MNAPTPGWRGGDALHPTAVHAEPAAEAHSGNARQHSPVMMHYAPGAPPGGHVYMAGHPAYHHAGFQGAGPPPAPPMPSYAQPPSHGGETGGGGGGQAHPMQVVYVTGPPPQQGQQHSVAWLGHAHSQHPHGAQAYQHHAPASAPGTGGDGEEVGDTGKRRAERTAHAVEGGRASFQHLLAALTAGSAAAAAGAGGKNGAAV